MIDILSPQARPALDAAARERLLLAFDFDGTLAPIVEDRTAARMRDTTRRLLRLVSLFYPCAVISGRSRGDLAPRLESVPLVALVGNHGAEAGYGPVDRSVRELVARWARESSALLRDLEGVEIEDKQLSLAIHFRGARDPQEAERAIRTAVESLSGARVFGGHQVVNVVPPDEHDKGEALARVLARVGRTGALYVGDDTTDEDAFRHPAVRVSVRVDRVEPTSAEYFLASQSQIDALLRALVAARLRLDGLDGRIEALERFV